MICCPNCGNYGIAKKEVKKGDRVAINGLVHNVTNFGVCVSNTLFVADSDLILYKCTSCDLKVAEGVKSKAPVGEQARIF